MNRANNDWEELSEEEVALLQKHFKNLKITPKQFCKVSECWQIVEIDGEPFMDAVDGVCPKHITEEDIVFSEFEDDMHEYIAEDIDRPHPHMGVVVNDYHDKLMKSIDDIHNEVIRANENVNILPTESNNMSEPREEQWHHDMQPFLHQGMPQPRVSIKGDKKEEE